MRNIRLYSYYGVLLLYFGFFFSCSTSPASDDSSGSTDAAAISDDAASDDTASQAADTSESSFSAGSVTDSTGESTAAGETTTASDSTDTGSDSSGTSAPVACSFFGTYSPSASGINVGGSLLTGYEPSDAVWHTRLNQLLLVSDEGLITMMDADGSGVTSWDIGGDLEGITVADPESDLIYIGVENPDAIVEFNINDGTVTRTFTLTAWMTGEGNQGLEALTFVPDSSQTEGGLFYAGHQGEGRIYVFELPVLTSATSTAVSYETSFVPVVARTDIAGLSYNATDDMIYIAYDASNIISAIETDGTFVNEWMLPGNDQEGIAIDEDCNLYVTEDDATHDVWIY